MRHALRRTLGIVAFGLVLALGAPCALAGYVDSSGREWRALTDTAAVSWDQLAAGDQASTPGNEGGVCPVGGGLCSGTRLIGSTTVDFSGWTWATRAEVAALLSAAPFSVPFGGGSTASELNSAWARAVLSAFGATFSIPLLIEQSLGWTADDELCTPALCQAGFSGVQDDLRTIYPDLGYSNLQQTNPDVAFFGAWLYRTVPEPPAFWLLAAALAWIAVPRRRTAII